MANRKGDLLIMPDSKKKVALLSNITADLLISKLHRKYDFYQPEGYDTWVQEVINPSAGLYNFGADAVVVLLDGTEVRNWKSMEEGSGRLGLWKQAISTLVFNITTSPNLVRPLISVRIELSHCQSESTGMRGGMNGISSHRSWQKINAMYISLTLPTRFGIRIYLSYSGRILN